MSNSIEKRIEIKAPVARVWRALTDHREFGEWFRVKIDGPFMPGEVSRGQTGTGGGRSQTHWPPSVGSVAPSAVQRHAVPSGSAQTSPIASQYGCAASSQNEGHAGTAPGSPLHAGSSAGQSSGTSEYEPSPSSTPTAQADPAQSTSEQNRERARSF